MLKKSNRLTTDFEFNITRKYGQKYSFPLFNLYWVVAKNYTGPAKVGFVVSNKISKNATQRNRIKRLLREAVHKQLKFLPSGVWISIFASQNAIDTTYETVSTQINQALQKISLPR